MGFVIYGRKCDSPKYEEIIDLSVKTLICVVFFLLNRNGAILRENFVLWKFFHLANSY
jgi:hypothetical protein